MARKIRFPRTINVFGEKIKLRIRHPVLDSDGNKVVGTYCFNTKVIEVDSKLDLEEKLETILHELGHAIFHRLSTGHSNNDTIPYELEEVIVNSFATMLMELFDIKFKKRKH